MKGTAGCAKLQVPGGYDMRVYKALFLLILAVCYSSALSAENTWSYSFGLSGTDYVWVESGSDLMWREHLPGLEIRGSAIIKPTGFYYGNFLNVSVPFAVSMYDEILDTSETFDSVHNLYLSSGLTFGYRWELKRRGNAFFTGVGPAAMMLADFDSHIWLSGGLAFEFGMESLGNSGIRFSFTCRGITGLGSTLVDLETADIHGEGFYDAPIPRAVSLILGISWTAVRK